MTEENKNTEPIVTGQTAGQEEKTFTQEEVNRIVQERLARAKNNDGKNSEVSQKETELKARELNIMAREKLLDAGINSKYSPLLMGATNEADLTKKVELLKEFTKNTKSGDDKPIGIKIGAPGSDSTKGSDAIREAMGL